MADETQAQTLQKSVSTYSESQGTAKPAYLVQPDVIAIPTAVPQQQGNSPSTQSTGTGDTNSSQGE